MTACKILQQPYSYHVRRYTLNTSWIKFNRGLSSKGNKFKCNPLSPCKPHFEIIGAPMGHVNKNAKRELFHFFNLDVKGGIRSFPFCPPGHASLFHLCRACMYDSLVVHLPLNYNRQKGRETERKKRDRKARKWVCRSIGTKVLS